MITAQRRIIRTFDWQLSRGRNAPRPVIAPISPIPVAAIARPDQTGFKFMSACQCIPPCIDVAGRCCQSL